MQQSTSSSNSPNVLTGSIDRFLRANGWRVSKVTHLSDGSGYEVTLTKDTEPDQGRTVTRRASSAGEATLKACSSARLPVSSTDVVEAAII